MICGGVSVKGNHALNQDRFMFFAAGGEAVAAVSDGVGSLPMSQVGAEALCGCVRDIFDQRLDIGAGEGLGSLIQKLWLTRLNGLDAGSCCATALVCFVRRGMITLAAVGDGYLCAIADGESSVLVDGKDDLFRNETRCLHAGAMDDDWRIICRPFKRLDCVYMSSDGLALKDESEAGIAAFVEDFFVQYRGMAPEDINAEMSGWVSAWTGSDDKTAAYIIG